MPGLRFMLSLHASYLEKWADFCGRRVVESSKRHCLSENFLIACARMVLRLPAWRGFRQVLPGCDNGFYVRSVFLKCSADPKTISDK